MSTSINPWNNKCCATCHCIVIMQEDNGGLYFKADCQCPHENGTPFKQYNNFPLELQLKEALGMIEVSSLFDFVCDSWKPRKPRKLK